MTFTHLLQRDPRFYAAISNFLPLEDQARLSQVSKRAKHLVDTANHVSFNLLKLSSVYENCKEQIEQLKGSWSVGQEVKDRIQAALPLIDQELKSSCRSLGIHDDKGAPFDFRAKPLSLMAKVKLAGLIDHKKAENLIAFFEQLAGQLPPAQLFIEETLTECQTIKEKAQQIREWMQVNRELLTKIKSLKEIGGRDFYFKKYYLSMPSEVFLLDGLDRDDFFRISRGSLEIHCPCLTRTLLKNPKLLALPPNWLGKLLEFAAFGGASHFINSLMDREVFKEIPADNIITAFEISSQKRNIGVMQAFMAHKRFAEIPNLNIGQAVIAAVAQRSRTLLDTLIKDSRFDLLTDECLSKALYLAIDSRQPGIAKSLLGTRRACLIQYESLKDLLETAYTRELFPELESFFKSFGKSLGAALQNPSMNLDPTSSAIETELKQSFISKAKRIISIIKDDHDDMGETIDSETEEELSFKESAESLSPQGKRSANDNQIDEPNAKRKKTSSPTSIYG